MRSLVNVEPLVAQVRAASVFKRYFGRDQATEESFDEDGFFRTGDTGAVINPKP
jgi:long-subunit acyl-CoA synthetase (AMP-forming)